MLTEFQRRVYDVLKDVPRGRVTTYKWLARRVDCGCAQAIGQALRSNPFAPRVPCHRVIASDLSPGGFKGKTNGSAVRKKLDLLSREGVVFESGRLVDSACLYVPE